MSPLSLPGFPMVMCVSFSLQVDRTRAVSMGVYHLAKSIVDGYGILLYVGWRSSMHDVCRRIQGLYKVGFKLTDLTLTKVWSRYPNNMCRSCLAYCPCSSLLPILTCLDDVLLTSTNAPKTRLFIRSEER